jgi:hypothetical protein
MHHSFTIVTTSVRRKGGLDAVEKMLSDKRELSGDRRSRQLTKRHFYRRETICIYPDYDARMWKEYATREKGRTLK